MTPAGAAVGRLLVCPTPIGNLEDVTLRVLAGLPYGEPHQHTPAVMVNLLGDIWFDDGATAAREPPWGAVLSHPYAKLHLYGKAAARRGRKMGHVTCLGASLDDALAAARQVKAALAIPGADDL